MTSSNPHRQLLLHACCGPCLLGVVPALHQRGYEVETWFHNPNIHGLVEFRRRIKAFAQAVRLLKVPFSVDGQYGLERFMAMWADRRDARCRGCYTMRLEATAAEAARRSIPLMTTTLLTSPHQDIEAVIEQGEAACRRHGVEFLGEDFRSYHDRAVAEAKHHSLYRQQYCGCIFSEFDRYRDSGTHRPHDLEDPVD